MAHTPGPIVEYKGYDKDGYIIQHSTGEAARRIIRCVNTHAALVEALQGGLEAIERTLTMKEINERRARIIAALTAAKGV